MNGPISCYDCSPPSLLSTGTSKEVNDVIHVHHIRHQHLCPYKPFNCSKCDQSFTVEQSLAAHSFLVHGEAISADEQNRGSKYLDVLCSLMKKCNLYSCGKKDSLSVELLQSVKQHSPMPLEPFEVQPEDIIPPLEPFLIPKLEPEEALPFHITLVGPEQERRTPSKEHRCPSCNKTFLSPTILRIHQQSKCIPDQKKYSSGSKGKKLMNSKKNVAAQKLKATYKKRRLSATCGLCGETFPSHSDALQHRINFHLAQPKITAAKKFRSDRRYCKECDRYFGSQALEHLAIFHLKKPTVACSKCDYTHWWKVCCVKSHIATRHKRGGAEVIDNRDRFKAKLKRLEDRMIV